MSENALYMRYLGALGLLAEVSVYLPSVRLRGAGVARIDRKRLRGCVQPPSVEVEAHPEQVGD